MPLFAFPEPPGDTRLIGEMTAFAGTVPPALWLMCDGSDVSRITYASLFEVVGTTYGIGDGSTTFGLPWETDPQLIIKAGV